MKNIKKISIILLTIILLNYSIIPIAMAVSFKKDTYSIDDTGKYILDIPGETTIKKFKSNISESVDIKNEDKNIEDEIELIKTGDKITIGENEYIAIVLGDIDSDGKCTYKDIIKEQEFVKKNKMIDVNNATTLNNIEKQAMDLNHDKVIEIRDLELIVSQDFPEKPKDGVENTKGYEYIWNSVTSGTTGSASDSEEEASGMTPEEHMGTPLEINGKEGWYIDSSTNYVYYFRQGLAVTGWQKLSRNGKSYNYYFYPDGVLCENLYIQFGVEYTKKNTKIVINKQGKYATLYVQSESGKYDTPTKSFVCRTGHDTKGGTGYKNNNKNKNKWYYHKGAGRWYHYFMFVGGTQVHGMKYKNKDNPYSLADKNSYNLFAKDDYRFTTYGSSSTMVTIMNSYLVYKIIQSNDLKADVEINGNKSPLPVHKVKKQPSGLNYDPTDPTITREYYNDTAYLQKAFATTKAGGGSSLF